MANFCVFQCMTGKYSHLIGIALIMNNLYCSCLLVGLLNDIFS